MMERNLAHKLITKEGAAELLSVSKRTIDAFIADGTLPKPIALGRRVYWHPAVFRAWQDKLFGIHVTPLPEPPQLRRGRPRTRFTT